jgi:hypothetical protein
MWCGVVWCVVVVMMTEQAEHGGIGGQLRSYGRLRKEGRGEVKTVSWCKGDKNPSGNVKTGCMHY